MSDDRRPTRPVGLLDMILQAESEVFRVDTWENVFKAEGQCLPESQVRYRDVARETARILDMLRLHRDAFLATVEQAREEAQANVAEGQERRRLDLAKRSKEAREQMGTAAGSSAS